MLSKLRSESGSAVVDFVLVAVPASLLVIPLIDLFGLYQSAIVKQQVAYDIARYAALADISLEKAALYRQLRDSSVTLSTERSGSSCTVLANAEVLRKVTFWPEVLRVQIQGRAECEN